MQRRVAAIYLVFFVVLGASAYSVMAMAEQPSVDIPNGETYENGSTLTAGDQQYLVQVEIEESEGDGHGGGGGAEPVGNLIYVNESAQATATWADGDVVTYLDEEYEVTVNASGSPARVHLVEYVNVTATLQNDSAVYNETVVVNGTESVTYREDNRNRPLDEYIAEQYPDRQRFQFVEGDEIEYDGETTTLTSIADGEATLTWTEPQEEQIELEEGSNVTLADGTTYFAHFDTHGDAPTVVLAPQSEYDAYQGDLARQENFSQRMNGLWGILILSGAAGLLIISLAYMPVRG
jgi:hypothetical protein